VKYAKVGSKAYSSKLVSKVGSKVGSIIYLRNTLRLLLIYGADRCNRRL